MKNPVEIKEPADLPPPPGAGPMKYPLPVMLAVFTLLVLFGTKLVPAPWDTMGFFAAGGVMIYYGGRAEGWKYNRPFVVRVLWLGALLIVLLSVLGWYYTRPLPP